MNTIAIPSEIPQQEERYPFKIIKFSLGSWFAEVSVRITLKRRKQRPAVVHVPNVCLRYHIGRGEWKVSRANSYKLGGIRIGSAMYSRYEDKVYAHSSKVGQAMLSKYGLRHERITAAIRKFSTVWGDFVRQYKLLALLCREELQEYRATLEFAQLDYQQRFEAAFDKVQMIDDMLNAPLHDLDANVMDELMPTDDEWNAATLRR